MKAKLTQKLPLSFTTFAGTAAVLLLYLITHVWNLWTFPVFADESIYVRWAQLFLDDWKQYLFFALNDGKTPLFVWMVAAAQSWNADQLVAARFVSVLGGLIQVIVVGAILYQLKARKFTQLLGMLLVAVLPFWFTYHRLAVMDGWLTVWLSISFWASLKAISASTKWRTVWLVLSGLAFGAALWTKLPALFYLPVFVVLPFFAERVTGKKQHLPKDPVKLIKLWLPQIVTAGTGLLVFALMRVSPAFGQLFSRGQDFSYSLSEVLVEGKWIESVKNVSRFVLYFGRYLTWPFMLAVVAGLFSNKERKTVALLLLCALLFLAPFIVVGKVVHPRYLLPAALFLTVAGCLSLESLYIRCTSAMRSGKLLWAGVAVMIAMLAGQSLTYASYFMANFIFSPDNTPFVQADRTQYLEEWSSGHGIIETVGLIQGLSSSHTVAVATEGRFGTLPDGLLMYFHGQNVDNIYLEGTGQYPVKTLPDFFVNRARSFDQSLLVVNSHRMEIDLPDKNLIAEFCRPNKAPCLQVWDITELVKAAPSIQNP